MPAAAADSAFNPAPRANFATTQWSVVLAAGGRSADARAALEVLCGAYWYPLYAFVRRQRYTADDAQDLTQAFFVELLEKEVLDVVRPERGKFRTFLLAALKHFLSKDRERQEAQKRGGGKTILSLDFADAERRYELEPADPSTPERLFNRRWALALLDGVLATLAQEHVAKGKEAIFTALQVYLTRGDASPSYAEAAVKLGISVDAVKVAVHRLRRRYRELLKIRIAETVASPAEIEEELRDLFAAVQAHQ